MTDISRSIEKTNTSRKTRLTHNEAEELQQIRDRKGKRNRTTRGNRIEWQPSLEPTWKNIFA